MNDSLLYHQLPTANEITLNAGVRLGPGLSSLCRFSPVPPTRTPTLGISTPHIIMHPVLFSILTATKMLVAISSSPKLCSTAKPPRLPRTPRSHSNSRSSNRCSSSNSANSPPFLQALLPLDLEGNRHPFARNPSLSLRPLHRLSHRTLVLRLLSIPADLLFYTRPLSLVQFPLPLSFGQATVCSLSSCLHLNIPIRNRMHPVPKITSSFHTKALQCPGGKYGLKQAIYWSPCSDDYVNSTL